MDEERRETRDGVVLRHDVLVQTCVWSFSELVIDWFTAERTHVAGDSSDTACFTESVLEVIRHKPPKDGIEIEGRLVRWQPVQCEP